MTGFGVKAIIERVVTKIRHAKANSEGSELIIIAHSFGTYVTSCILRDHPDVRCSRAIFCGSVVPRNFHFYKVANCPEIVNDCGGRDIWPVIAQGFGLWRRYGAGGVWGLRTSGVEDRFHDFGHSGYLNREFVNRYWKPYIERNILVPSPYQTKRRPTPKCISLLSFGWLLTFVLILFAAIFITTVSCLASIDAMGWVLLFAVLFLVVCVCTSLWFVSGICAFCRPRQATSEDTGTSYQDSAQS